MMPISHLRKFIFFHIPKTGGTSISKCLKLERRGVEYAWGSRRQHLTWQEMLVDEYVTEEQMSNYFKFSFVRNPFDRIVSCFLYQKRAKEIDRNISFSKYVAIAHERRGRNYIKRYFYFRPQCEFICRDGANILDFVGRFEYINRDFKDLMSYFDMKCPRLLHAQRSRKRKSYQSYYSKKSKNLVRKMYAKDLDIFGYSFRGDK